MEKFSYVGSGILGEDTLKESCVVGEFLDRLGIGFCCWWIFGQVGQSLCCWWIFGFLGHVGESLCCWWILLLPPLSESSLWGRK